MCEAIEREWASETERPAGAGDEAAEREKRRARRPAAAAAAPVRGVYNNRMEFARARFYYIIAVKRT